MLFTVQSNLIWLITLMLMGLLVLAVIVEIIRRKKERKNNILQQWNTVNTIIVEKEFNEEEASVLRKIIEKYEPNNPINVVTIRQNFNRCVQRYVQDLRKSVSFEELDNIGNVLKEIRVRLGMDYIPYGQRIYSTAELYTNQTLWMSLHLGVSESWRKGKVSGVNEAFFRVAPFTAQDKMNLKEGDEVVFRTWRDDDGRYQFKTIYRGKEEDVYVFDHAFTLERYQTRAYLRVRMEKTIDVNVVKISNKYDLNQISAEDIPYKVEYSTKARVVNISAGGCALLIDRDIDEDLFLQFDIELEDEGGQKSIKLITKILEKLSVSLGRYMYRGVFVGVTNELREKLIKYVYRLQPPISTALKEQQRLIEEKKKYQLDRGSSQ
ncbi:MAG: PilZ domain-containing protein [Candidatus Hydrogenedentes bacterium]|nr:PilZ domain-containing protein [Candidatus Hydrogenedentota bacterium]